MRLPVHIANNIFKTNVTVYDEIVTRAKGQQVTVKEDNRTISATIQPAGDKAQAMLPDGAIQDGVVSIFTSSTLSSYNATQSSEEQRQTFVLYAGETWKVHVVQNWALHMQSNINKYLATKYLNVNDN